MSLQHSLQELLQLHQFNHTTMFDYFSPSISSLILPYKINLLNPFTILEENNLMASANFSATPSLCNSQELLKMNEACKILFNNFIEPDQQYKHTTLACTSGQSLQVENIDQLNIDENIQQVKSVLDIEEKYQQDSLDHTAVEEWYSFYKSDYGSVQQSFEFGQQINKSTQNVNIIEQISNSIIRIDYKEIQKTQTGQIPQTGQISQTKQIPQTGQIPQTDIQAKKQLNVSELNQIYVRDIQECQQKFSYQLSKSPLNYQIQNTLSLYFQLSRFNSNTQIPKTLVLSSSKQNYKQRLNNLNIYALQKTIKYLTKKAKIFKCEIKELAKIQINPLQGLQKYFVRQMPDIKPFNRRHKIKLKQHRKNNESKNKQKSVLFQFYQVKYKQKLSYSILLPHLHQKSFNIFSKIYFQQFYCHFKSQNKRVKNHKICNKKHTILMQQIIWYKKTKQSFQKALINQRRKYFQQNVVYSRFHFLKFYFKPKIEQNDHKKLFDIKQQFKTRRRKQTCFLDRLCHQKDIFKQKTGNTLPIYLKLCCQKVFFKEKYFIAKYFNQLFDFQDDFTYFWSMFEEMEINLSLSKYIQTQTLELLLKQRLNEKYQDQFYFWQFSITFDMEYYKKLVQQFFNFIQWMMFFVNQFICFIKIKTLPKLHINGEVQNINQNIIIQNAQIQIQLQNEEFNNEELQNQDSFGINSQTQEQQRQQIQQSGINKNRIQLDQNQIQNSLNIDEENQHFNNSVIVQANGSRIIKQQLLKQQPKQFKINNKQEQQSQQDSRTKLNINNLIQSISIELNDIQKNFEVYQLLTRLHEVKDQLIYIDWAFMEMSQRLNTLKQRCEELKELQNSHICTKKHLQKENQIQAEIIQLKNCIHNRILQIQNKLKQVGKKLNYLLIYYQKMNKNNPQFMQKLENYKKWLVQSIHKFIESVLNVFLVLITKKSS